MSDPLVVLKGGLSLPEAAIVLVLDLERRGISMSVDGETLRVKGPDGPPDLSEADKQAIRTLKPSIIAAITYRCPDGLLP